MRMVDLIEKKRDGKMLSSAEITEMIDRFTGGEVPDYQMAAMLMAIYFQGMTSTELGDLTTAMVSSGDVIDLSEIDGIKVDKHSTGGVGDTTTLVLAPLVASVGVPVAKMSGRGLGHTGGTLDKLEAIEGFHIELTDREFFNLVNKNKIAVIGQSGNLTPADKLIYALRDVTATVQSIPLIASSIMSKKIAAGSDAIVLDVKMGSGAFMKDLHQAKELARTMVGIGRKVGRETVAVISDMNQPLGEAVGNGLEVAEAIQTLKGEGPSDLTELCLVLGSQMVYLGGGASTLEEARQLLEDSITNGQAIETFKTFVESQGGNPTVADDLSLLPQAAYQHVVRADRSGYISDIHANEIGLAAMLLGAGRATKEASLDLAAGLKIHKKIGDPVTCGDKLATLYANTADFSESAKKVHEHMTISEEAQRPPLIYEVIDA